MATSRLSSALVSLFTVTKPRPSGLVLVRLSDSHAVLYVIHPNICAHGRQVPISGKGIGLGGAGEERLVNFHGLRASQPCFHHHFPKESQ